MGDMKYYKDPTTSKIYAYEVDGSQDEYIKPGLVQITNEEFDALRAPSPVQIQQRINESSRAYLASTDWYGSRFLDDGTPIPDDILTARQAARDSIVESVDAPLPSDVTW